MGECETPVFLAQEAVYAAFCTMNAHPSRRDVLFGSLALAAAAQAAPPGAHRTKTKMTIHLTPGSIGLQGTQREVIEWAAQYGFDAVEPQPVALAAMSATERQAMAAEVKSRALVWGNAGLPVDFRKDANLFGEGLKLLPARAKALQEVGVTRVGTYILPSHDTLTYVQNLRQHGARLRECAAILRDHGQRLGLEYVGPKTLWTARRYPFVHSMAEMRDLLGEINLTNVGFLLDSWHWHTAGETVADLKTVKAEEVICCDLNDAPAGVPLDQQIDARRELPAATGVIDLAGFLNTLNELGCDAPVRPEPFNATLRGMPREQILTGTAAAMHKAFALIR